MQVQVREEIDSLRKQVEELPSEAVADIQALRDRIRQLESQLKTSISAWDQVQLARHQERPYTLDYVYRIFEDFRELYGDRKFSDDPAIVGGTALLGGLPVMVVGHQKGRNTKDRIFRNYGMPKPEGYRKAVRLMSLAEKFGRPILTFIDTPGAYPGIGAEERGQASAIAWNLRVMASLRVPVICSVLGEGGSGGALAIGVGDRILMLQYSIYSVISPESCSAILWKDQEHAREAAESLKLTAHNLYKLGVIDEIVPEPAGGAHNDFDEVANTLKEALLRHLSELSEMDAESRLEARFAKFRAMGAFVDESLV